MFDIISLCSQSQTSNTALCELQHHKVSSRCAEMWNWFPQGWGVYRVTCSHANICMHKHTNPLGAWAVTLTFIVPWSCFSEHRCNKRCNNNRILLKFAGFWKKIQATVFSLINVLFNNLHGHPNCGVGSCFSALNWKTLASALLPFLLLLFSPLLLPFSLVYISPFVDIPRIILIFFFFHTT